MAELNHTNVAAIFNTIYPDGVESIVMPVSPMVGIIGKDIKAWNGLGGNGKSLVWEYGGANGASGDYAVSAAQYGNEQIARLTITRGRLFAHRRISHEDWEATDGNNTAAVGLMKQAVDGAMRQLKKRVGTLLNGGPVGAIGRIAVGSGVTTAAITLSNPSQAKNFQNSQRLQVLNGSTYALRAASVVTLTSTGVNLETGVLTASAHWDDTVAGVADGDYLIPEGDLGQVPTTMDQWNPPTLITAADSWFGISRNSSIEMQGCRYAATAGSLDEVLVRAAAYHSDLGGEADICFANPIDVATLKSDLHKVQVHATNSQGREIASVSYDAVVVKGPAGDIQVFSDPYRPRGWPRLTKRDSWKIWTLGEMFRRLTKGTGGDGLQKVADADASLMAFGGYWQLVCERPIDSCIISIPGAATI